MRIRIPVVLASALALAACDPSAVSTPPTSELAIAGSQPLNMSDDCGDGWDCQPLAPLYPVNTDPSAIASSCTETLADAIGISAQLDTFPRPHTVSNPGALFVDGVWLRPAGGGPDFLQTAGHSCWECKGEPGGCGGINCPDSLNCAAIPGTPGSDCQAFPKCPDTYDFHYRWGYNSVPQCRKWVGTGPPPPTGTPPAPPITRASSVDGRPYISWAAIPGADGYRVYRQVDFQAQPDIWYTTTATSYHDGTTTATPVKGYPPPSPWVKYYVVSFNQSGMSDFASLHYYRYTGGVPPI